MKGMKEVKAKTALSSAFIAFRLLNQPSVPLCLVVKMHHPVRLNYNFLYDRFMIH